MVLTTVNTERSYVHLSPRGGTLEGFLCLLFYTAISFLHTLYSHFHTFSVYRTNIWPRPYYHWARIRMPSQWQNGSCLHKAYAFRKLHI